ncbi:MAG: DUF2807 domain-containing protein [Bacteroidales bacterium]|nr:DUF2807 domain-containing protein [Bacteroidales bacterium]
MKTNSKLLIISLIAFNFFTYQFLQAQFIKGDGNVTKSERNVSSFKSVEVEDGIDLYISQGSKESLEIEADQNLHQYIMTEVNGDNLRIFLSKSIRKAKTLKIKLSVVDIKGLSASGGSDIYTQGSLKLNDLSVICSGGSDIRLEIETAELKFKASGGSDGYIKGTAKVFKAKASGGSDIKATGLEAGTCEIEVTGGSDAEIYATGELQVRATGGSDVSYKGKPSKIDSNMSGGSSLHHDSF